jgi:hypothetical protein
MASLLKYIDSNVVQKNSENLVKHTFIFIDWDDTILPTKWILSNNPAELYNADSIQSLFTNNTNKNTKINQTDVLATQLLEEIMKYGRIYFVTNGLRLWFYGSARYYLPKTYKFIMKHKIEVLSAREEQMHNYPLSNELNQTLWKYYTFKKVLDRDNLTHNGNIISIGDGIYEYNAIGRIQEENLNYNVKRVKFKTLPTLDKIIEEHIQLKNDFSSIVKNNKSIYNYEGDKSNIKELFQVQIVNNFINRARMGKIGSMYP